MGLADQLVYASDYPHEDAGFPGSVQQFKARKDLSDEVKGRILGSNALRLYGKALGVKASAKA